MTAQDVKSLAEALLEDMRQEAIQKEDEEDLNDGTQELHPGRSA